MRISMWTTFLYGLTPEMMVTTFAEHGWKWAELSTEHGLELVDRGDPEKVGREFARFAEDQGLRFPQGHLWLQADIAHPDKNERARTMDILKKSCDLFAALGIGAAVLHAGGEGLRDLGCEAEKIFERQLEGLEEVSTFVRGGAVTICLENDGEGIGPLLALIEAVKGSELGICLDTGHLNMGGKDCAEFVRRAGPLLKALHIADNRGERDDHMFPFAPGATIKWDGFVDALRQIGYTGLFNYEVPGESISRPLEVRLAKLDYARALAHQMLGS